MIDFDKIKTINFSNKSLEDISSTIGSIITDINNELNKDISENFEIDFDASTMSGKFIINNYNSLLEKDQNPKDLIYKIKKIIDQHSLQDDYDEEISTIGKTKRIPVEEDLYINEEDENKKKEILRIRNEKINAIREYMQLQKSNDTLTMKKLAEEKKRELIVKEKSKEIKNYLAAQKIIDTNKKQFIFPIDKYLLQKYKTFRYPFSICKTVKKEGKTNSKNIQKLAIIIDFENFDGTKKIIKYLDNISEENLQKFKKITLMGKYTPIFHREDLMDKYKKDFELKIKKYFKNFYEKCKKVTEVEFGVLEILVPLVKYLGIKPALLNYFIYFDTSNEDEDENQVYEKGEISNDFNDFLSQFNFTENTNSLLNGEINVIKSSCATFINELKNILENAHYMVGGKSINYSCSLKYDISSKKLYINKLKDLKGEFYLLSEDYKKYIPMEKEIKENLPDSKLKINEIKTMNIELPKNKDEILCKNCNKNIPENKAIYYCYICNIFYCQDCTENQFTNPMNNGLSLFIHPQHNLIYFLKRDEKNLHNIEIKRLGTNLYYTKIQNGGEVKFLKHSASCNNCRGDFTGSPRYLCLGCRPGAPMEGGYFDYCYDCIKKYREMENPPNDKDEVDDIKKHCYGEKVNFLPEHVHKEHPFLFIIAEAQDYYNF